jgi:tRNA threonylcarbamoyl adenosine modification protein YeaZ
VFVLAIDTSSPSVTAGVVALGDGLALVSSRAPIAPRGHGELLAPAIAECLDEAGIAAREVGAVVAGDGPGPYTGLRVGLMTAAAFADALGVPTYGACSLDAVVPSSAIDTLVVTDARRREVYWATYRDGRRLTGPHVAQPADVPLDGVGAIAGAAVDLYDWPTDITRLPCRYPDPLALVALARQRIDDRASGEPLVPRYLRHPDAVAPGAPKTVSQPR